MKSMIKQLKEIKKEVYNQAIKHKPFTEDFEVFARIHNVIQTEINKLENEQ